MKIAIIAYGHTDNVVCLANHLAKNLDTTLIFVTSGKRFTRSIFDWDVSSLPYGLTTDRSVISGYLGEEVGRFVDPSLKIFIARTHDRKILQDWKRDNLKSIEDVARYVINNKFDLVHFNGSSGFQLYFHYFLRKFPKVLTVHDYIPHSGDASMRGIYVNIALNSVYTKFDYHFIQHHEYLTKRFVDFYKVAPDRVHTVNSGPLDVYRFFIKKGIAEEPNTILFFGRISSYKGIEYLINAIPDVQKRIESLKVIIAGSGRFGFGMPNYDFLEIHNRYIPSDELVSMLQRSSVVVAPYTDATHSAVIMTSFALHKPVVASAVGGIPEVVRNDVTGKLVPPKDRGALSNALIDVLENKDKRDVMKENIARLGKEGDFAWDNISRKTIDVYRRAIENSNL
jgi:glycosyltransferase involved in cell wall biosynthesis